MTKADKVNEKMPILLCPQSCCKKITSDWLVWTTVKSIMHTWDNKCSWDLGNKTLFRILLNICIDHVYLCFFIWNSSHVPVCRVQCSMQVKGVTKVLLHWEFIDHPQDCYRGNFNSCKYFHHHFCWWGWAGTCLRAKISGINPCSLDTFIHAIVFTCGNLFSMTITSLKTNMNVLHGVMFSVDIR